MEAHPLCVTTPLFKALLGNHFPHEEGCTTAAWLIPAQVRDGVERRFGVLLDTRAVLSASLNSLTAHVLGLWAARAAQTQTHGAPPHGHAAPHDPLAARPTGGLSYSELFRDAACQLVDCGSFAAPHPATGASSGRSAGRWAALCSHEEGRGHSERE